MLRAEYFYGFVWTIYELGVEALMLRDLELVRNLAPIADETFQLLIHTKLDSFTPIYEIREYIDESFVTTWSTGDGWTAALEFLDDKGSYAGPHGEEVSTVYATAKGFGGDMAEYDRYLHLFRALYHLSIEILASYDLVQLQLFYKVVLTVKEMLHRRDLDKILPIDEILILINPQAPIEDEVRRIWNDRLLELEGFRSKYPNLLK